MDKELQEYYENRFDMMATQGWKDLMGDVEEMINATDRLSSITADKSVDFRKGELSIMNWIKMLKPLSEDAYEELKNASST